MVIRTYEATDGKESFWHYLGLGLALFLLLIGLAFLLHVMQYYRIFGC